MFVENLVGLFIVFCSNHILSMIYSYL